MTLITKHKLTLCKGVSNTTAGRVTVNLTSFYLLTNIFFFFAIQKLYLPKSPIYLYRKSFEIYLIQIFPFLKILVSFC